MTSATSNAQPDKPSERNNPGCRAEDFFAHHTVLAIDDIDSVLGTQQYIQSLIRRDHADVDTLVQLPLAQDELLWQYEQLRYTVNKLVCLELNHFVPLLEDECDPTAACAEMRAQQWQYLCAAHETPQNCSAIDYAVHTLDGATALLNSNKHFPSRVNIAASSVSHFQSIARRLYRIFAHAYFHHREVFEQFEANTSLYLRFLKFLLMFKLMGKDLITIPMSTSNDALVTSDNKSTHRKNDTRRPSTVTVEGGRNPTDIDTEYSSSESESEQDQQDNNSHCIPTVNKPERKSSKVKDLTVDHKPDIRDQDDLPSCTTLNDDDDDDDEKHTNIKHDM